MINKGIILAGGTGTRLNPITISVSKQLMPIYDKPMIYYPLSTLMEAKIKDILIITTPHDQILFKKLLSDGKHIGINISYAVQAQPNGIAESFIIGEKFINNSPVALILGDNIFYGYQLDKILMKNKKNNLSTIFGYQVNNPESYGVIEISNDNKVKKIVEKPKKPKSSFAVTGMYFYDKNVVSYAKKLKPSARGELEITDLNNIYLKNNKLNFQLLDSGIAWLDTGTHENLLNAQNFISVVQKRQGIMIGCPEEIAFKNKWIDKNQIKNNLKNYKNSDYETYLKKILI
jgi:glucose-1-phosphate thymidylyltransferase